ncbi:hypothetical protein BGC07_08620 [Piscirickettsia litoralis]|uniref:CDP-glycerol--glycerophosphate glycerophosphotransferase n=1 Tax=Piscirickettsia litoralis TaxID=1891921 RepID=A0ABX3A286_9GAMM|nr:hypothetical protein BGC07_08620 [Piscirickettsia litoralis]
MEHKEKKKQSLTYNRLITYMPTFRHGNDNFVFESGIDFDVLNKYLERNNDLLLLKFHINTKIDRNAFAGYKNIKFVHEKENPYDLICETDLLITDYSSIAYDYLLLDRPIIYYPFDLDQYKNTDRAMYTEYDEFVAGPVVETFDDLLTTLFNDEDLKKSLQSQRKSEIWGEKVIGCFTVFKTKLLEC